MKKPISLLFLAASVLLLGCLGDTPATASPSPVASLTPALEATPVASTPALVPAVDGRPEPSPTSGVTRAQVASHDTPDDCWVILDGAAYDVTSYITKHPGGSDAVIETCGTEVTGVFQPGSPSFKPVHEGKASELSPYLVADVTG
jgi:cytochrome b involved in lipid metabolism